MECEHSVGLAIAAEEVGNHSRLGGGGGPRWDLLDWAPWAREIQRHSFGFPCPGERIGFEVLPEAPSLLHDRPCKQHLARAGSELPIY